MKLGGNVVKKRISVGTRGKSGGIRTLIATHKQSHWFFIYGFEKKERSNISSDELDALQAIASELLVLSSQELNQAVEDATLEEICNDTKP